MNGMWVLGLLLLFFGFGCFALAFVKNKQQFVARLIYTIFPPAGKKDLFGTQSAFNFRSGGDLIRWEPDTDRGRNIIKISAVAKSILPSPLVVIHRRGRRGKRDFRNQLMLELKDLAAINREAEREVLGREIMDGLSALARECIEFSITHKRITALRAYNVGSNSEVERFNHMLIRIVNAFRRAVEDDDFRLPAARFIVLHRTETDRRVNALQTLTRFYSHRKNADDVLRTAVEDADFDVAAAAAAGLGMDVEQFAFQRIALSGTPYKLKAISYLVGHPSAAVLEFLLARLSEESSGPAQAGIIGALGWYDDPRVEPILLTALRSGRPDLLPGAVRALAARGGRDALEPLYAVAFNRSLSKELRLAAGETMRVIRNRLGLERSEAGRLSLSRTADEAGELSLTEGTGNGRIKRSKKRTPTAGESDE
ncbi:MAG: HEAT repeat domain-containing protein [Spirochaetales bacterium]|nr:HEAT repeat domain-containing protein [Spirochaetales bacterium]